MQESVYQPTTTSLGDGTIHKSWMPSLVASQSSSSLMSRTLVVVLALLFAVMGLVMIIVGATSYRSLEDGTAREVNSTAYVVILCLGVVMELAAVISLVAYLRIVGYQIPCWPGKIATIRRHLHQNHVMLSAQGGEPVGAQYWSPSQPDPASNAHHAPTNATFTDVSEHQLLMAHKADTGDDSERILDEDPRIVLTPLKPHEEC